MNITIFVEPRSGRKIPFAVGAEKYRRFADELGRFADSKVPIVTEITVEAWTEGYVLWATSGDPARLLSSYDPEFRSQIAARTVLLDVSWQKALEQLEQYSFAAAVDSLRMSEWMARPSNCAGPF